MKSVIHSKYLAKKNSLVKLIKCFDTSEEHILKENRNTLKLFELDDITVNIKSFKIPNLVNRIVYQYFRKGKAQRSFEYAKKLIDLGIGTPQPIAYFKQDKGLLFGRSFYISEQLNYDLTYRELIHDFNYPDYENIIRSFTQFTYQLHEKGIQFLDHSPGNTLIIKRENDYDFYLVDLNRMNFGTLDFETRIKNFARLTPHRSMVEIMSDEYAKCVDSSFEKVFELMWKETQNFQYKFHRKKRIKKKLKFWKK
ncbi:MAG: Kdo domain containing protein [Winogradskyella sp.]|uniref:lipopolysaccharide kinase InaA family protein n=1 Tax=Winogradskyella sp. TaxID=1883156 RepID=UPI0018333482|nr:lipopolysaccharide kinase InaA family protein [Winogradskyella sp.]MBT8245543.1 lipopolysaccharide kinase InaA family protein [Winogradskyella sp.]NNK23928.1 Kdo domain containing protein [Winogradskyella sp.]